MFFQSEKQKQNHIILFTNEGKFSDSCGIINRKQRMLQILFFLFRLSSRMSTPEEISQQSV